ncbi:hypothetical protein GCM10027052_25700 [Parafrigoribacterium mesophilum]
MSGYSERSQELAEQLRVKATRNLERSGKFVTRSAETGKFATKGRAKRNPSTTVSEHGSGGSRPGKG